jgi:cell pole-organizing protein PopZ
MEDILASIRRILNEEEAPDGGPPAPGSDDVLILDRSMMIPSPEADPEPHSHAEPARHAPPQPAMEASTSIDPIAPPDPAHDLVAPEAAAAAASSVGSLGRTLAAGRATQVYAGGPTLEDMVRAELRPLLKEWLDSNLPPVVERLVRTEIERVVGRAVP